MADGWDMPLGADARSFSSKQIKYDAWDDDYVSIHSTGNSIQNATKSMPNATESESDGWMSAKSKSSKPKQSTRNTWKGGKQDFNEGKRNYSKHSQHKSTVKNSSYDNNCDGSWNTYESNNYSSRDWNFVDNSKYAQSQASAPVNVWEERSKRREAIKSMEPTTETEEEAMMRHAIELSKREAQKDEENQKKLAKEYELQMQLLASNPEMIECISEALDEHTSSFNHSALENNATLNEESRDLRNESKSISENPIYNGNGTKSTSYGGAKPKFNKIIDSFGGWGIKENESDYAKETSESNDCWDEPNINSHSHKTTGTGDSFGHDMSKSQKKQPKGKKNLKKQSYTEFNEEDSFYLKNEKKYSEKNDYQNDSSITHDEGFDNIESNFTFFPDNKKVESLHSSNEIEEKDNSPSYSKINHEVSDGSVEPNSKTVTEFDDFMHDLKRGSGEDIHKTEVNISESDVFWEDKKSVQFGDNNWEKNGVDLVRKNKDTFNDKSESCDLFSFNSFDALTISSNNEPYKNEDQSSYSFPTASDGLNVSTYNTSEFLCSNPNIAADRNLSSSDVPNSTRYCDFQANDVKENEIVTEEKDMYNPFTSKMPSVSKQTLLEENAHVQSKEQTFQLPADNFVSVEEGSPAVHHNPTLNQSPSSFIMPNLSLGAPVLPVPMPLGTFNPAFMSPYTNPVIMQQLLMLNNPFFVKQLQVLDMYYRSAGIPCSSIPFSPMQMPPTNSPLQDPIFSASQNQIPPENEHNVSPTFPFSNENEVSEKMGEVHNPLGLNNLMRAKYQIDPLQQAEINSFLDKYCDIDFEEEIPPIPPPKPAPPKCNDSSNLMVKPSALEVTSGNNVYNESQKNFDLTASSTFHEETTASSTIHEDVVPIKVKQNAPEKESIGWGDLDESNAQHQKKYMWNEEVDGWGNESATVFMKNASKMETRNKSMIRQPSSQPIAGRYKR